MSQCLTNAGFTLKNNKKAAIGTTFQPKDGWKALQAPEVCAFRQRFYETPLTSP